MMVRLDLKPLERWIAKLKRQAVSNSTANKMADTYYSFARKKFPKALIGTGTLIKALKRNAKGNLTETLPNGVRCGFAETNMPNRNVTYADVVEFHETGAGNNVKREILPEPDGAVIAKITKLVARDII